MCETDAVVEYGKLEVIAFFFNNSSVLAPNNFDNTIKCVVLKSEASLSHLETA